MRERLKLIVGKKMRFEATLFKFGKRWTSDSSFYDTVMVTNLKDRNTGMALADHLWFNDAGWAKGLDIGQKISFVSIVVPYEHGWDEDGKETFDFDYALSTPKGVFGY